MRNYPHINSQGWRYEALPDGYRRVNDAYWRHLQEFKTSANKYRVRFQSVLCLLFGHLYDARMVFEVGSRKSIGQLYHGAVCPICLEEGQWVMEEYLVKDHSDIPAV